MMAVAGVNCQFPNTTNRYQSVSPGTDPSNLKTAPTLQFSDGSSPYEEETGLQLTPSLLINATLPTKICAILIPGVGGLQAKGMDK